jgi:hypothetical protein
MSDSDAPSGTSHVIDIAQAVPDAAYRQTLIDWGAEFLSHTTNEDTATRCASLALEIRDYLSRSHRARGQRISSWQLRLAAVAIVVACVRRKQELAQQMGDDNNVRH